MQVSVLENIFIVMVFLISDHFFSVGRLNQLCYVIHNDKQEQLFSLSPRIFMLNYFFLSHVYNRSIYNLLITLLESSKLLAYWYNNNNNIKAWL